MFSELTGFRHHWKAIEVVHMPWALSQDGCDLGAICHAGDIPHFTLPPGPHLAKGFESLHVCDDGPFNQETNYRARFCRNLCLLIIHIGLSSILPFIKNDSPELLRLWRQSHHQGMGTSPTPLCCPTPLLQEGICSGSSQARTWEDHFSGVS